jgi:preprotein translocase subunit SecD
VIGASFRVFEKAGLSGLFLYGALIASICGILGHPAMAEPLALEVAKAAVSVEPRTNQALITFTLKEASRRSFADFTAANVGRTIEIRIDGRVMMKPVIREPITGGIGQVAGSFSAGEAKAIADRLTSGAARLEVEAVP